MSPSIHVRWRDELAQPQGRCLHIWTFERGYRFTIHLYVIERSLLLEYYGRPCSALKRATAVQSTEVDSLRLVHE